MKNFELIKTLVAEAEADVNDLNNGKKAAVSRVRAHAQKIKQACQDLRKEALEKREELNKATK